MQRPRPDVLYRILRRSGASRAAVVALMIESIVRREARGVHRVLALHGRTRAGAPAVVVPRDGAGGADRRVGFAELARSVRAIAGALGARGLRPRDRLVVALANSPEVLAVTGALRTLGAVRVPASPAWKAGELRHCLENSGARGIVFEPAARAQALEAGRGLDALRAGLCADPAELLAAGGDRAPLPPDELSSAPDNPAIVYTSGTTGRPKGARPWLPDPAAMIEMLIGLFRLGAGETILIPAPLYHAAPAILAEMAVALGATLVLPPRFDPEQTLAAIERERVTLAYLVPYMLERILELPATVRRAYGHASLRAVLSGAAPLRPEVRVAACDLFGDLLMELYGSTETGVATFLAPEEQRLRPDTVGRAIAGVDVRIFDAEDGRELEPGEVGEVCVRSAWVQTEYLPGEEKKSSREASSSVLPRPPSSGLAEETAASHPAGPGGAAFFRTGDLGALDADGWLRLHGRLKDVVNTGGVKVFPAEVERAISAHPAVREVAVFPLADPRWGEAVAAAVVRAPGMALDEAGLQAWLKERVAGYKVPKRVFFEAELPRNPQGKVLKRVLKERYERERERSA